MSKFAGTSVASDRSHWDRVYTQKDPHGVSWYEPVLQRSLALVAEADLEPSAPILDAGGGASTLAAWLLDAGHTDVTVADISPTALEHARAELRQRADRVTWVEADLRDHDFGRAYELWHDRAAFHFMVDPGDRAAYLDTLRRSLSPEGHAVIASFGPQGPTRCSGLPTMRYGAAELERLLGEGFELVSSSIDTHRTPSGGEQQFLHAHLRRLG